MYTGRQTLTSINSTVEDAHEQVREIEHHIQESTDQLIRLEKSESDQYRSLARLRVNLLAAGKIVETLDESERTVAVILRQREEELERLRQKIGESEDRHISLDVERDEQSHRVDLAAEKLDKAEAATQQRLQENAGYQEQLKKAQLADRIAIHAEEKKDLASQDRIEKGTPYENEPLFMYLWKRGYGTSRYHANPLTRFLDGKVADICRYEDARANYHMLLEIPRRLGEHAESLRTQADAEFTALENLEKAAAGEDGIPALQENLAEMEEQLTKLDNQLEEHEKQHQELIKQKALFATGEDSHYRQAIELLANDFRRADIMTLHRDAQLTPLPEDDLVVDQLSTIGRKKQHIQDTLSQQRTLMSSHRQRLKELEQLRVDFKRARFDSMNSSFRDGSFVTLLLNQFLNGMLSREGLWQEIIRQQQTRPTHSKPSFGSGGFGRRSRVWHSGGSIGLPRGGGGGFGSRGGGGFRTGGGF